MEFTPNALKVLKNSLLSGKDNFFGIRINIIHRCCTPKP
jgi:hypothetical protein